MAVLQVQVLCSKTRYKQCDQRATFIFQLVGAYIKYPCAFCTLDKMKDAVIAKVAAQAADFYKTAYNSTQVTSLKQVMEKVTSSTYFKQN